MISTHVLDTSKGEPGRAIKVTLQKKEASGWIEVIAGITDKDGRFSFECEILNATYQIIFETEDYFKRDSKEFFFLNHTVVFKIDNLHRKYHIPLLISPFGYSTYRGS